GSHVARCRADVDDAADDRRRVTTAARHLIQRTDYPHPPDLSKTSNGSSPSATRSRACKGVEWQVAAAQAVEAIARASRWPCRTSEKARTRARTLLDVPLEL
ncbi:MAG TPA: hypothetical protein PLP58_21875, partial [Prosthecobacter sp.]|nr:hypothetical protein [Prosthecobacter sp.]